MRYFLELAYDGTTYHGWQIQKNAISVQEVLNDSISKILRQNVEVTGSGRTDTGVHASYQVAHFDIEMALNSDFCHRLNRLLPPSIVAKDIKQVKNDVSARFDAIRRSYVYQIIKQKDPFRVGAAYLYTKELNVELMNQCCIFLKQWQDFQCFSKVHTDVAHFGCDIFEANWEEANEGLTFFVSANRFLRGMVRCMVGTLLLVGEQKLDVEGFQEILKSKDRKNAGRSVPAHGLYLCDVIYPEEIYI